MNPIAFDALSRRASLATFALAGLAAVARPLATVAKKNRRKNNGKKGDVNKLCKKQVRQCIDASAPDCDNDPECLADVDRCCSLLGTCDFAGSFACFAAVED